MPAGQAGAPPPAAAPEPQQPAAAEQLPPAEPMEEEEEIDPLDAFMAAEVLPAVQQVAPVRGVPAPQLAALEPVLAARLLASIRDLPLLTAMEVGSNNIPKMTTCEDHTCHSSKGLLIPCCMGLSMHVCPGNLLPWEVRASRFMHP